jgi:hypothetical protein
VRNNERYLAFPPAVTQAFVEVSDLRRQFLLYTFSTCRVLEVRKHDHTKFSIRLDYRYGTPAGTIQYGNSEENTDLYTL